MSLSCDKHHRRIIFTSKSIHHRNGDGSICDSEMFRMGTREFTDMELLNYVSYLDVLKGYSRQGITNEAF